MEAAVALDREAVLRLADYIGRLAVLLTRTLRWIGVPPFKTHRVLVQARRIGLGSFFICALVAFFVGVIIALQMAYQMIKLSAEIYIPNVVAVSLVRELAPVLTALVVAGRIGAGITAEIASMKVTEQIDALRAFAVDPIRFLVVPRFLALVVMVPVLTVYADLIGIAGGFTISTLKLGINPSMFWTMVTEALVVKDIVTGIVKAVVFGMIIALVGCHEGLSVEGGAEGVGRATTHAVVNAFLLILTTDCLFTMVFYFLFHA